MKKSEKLYKELQSRYHKYDMSMHINDFCETPESDGNIYHPNNFQLIMDLFDSSLNENFYWEFCHIDVYKSTLRDRLNEFLNTSASYSDFLDFIEDELQLLNNYDLFYPNRDLFDSELGQDPMNFAQFIFMDYLPLSDKSEEERNFLETLYRLHTKKIALLKSLKTLPTDQNRYDALNDLIRINKKTNFLSNASRKSLIRNQDDFTPYNEDVRAFRIHSLPFSEIHCMSWEDLNRMARFNFQSIKYAFEQSFNMLPDNLKQQKLEAKIFSVNEILTNQHIFHHDSYLSQNEKYYKRYILKLSKSEGDIHSTKIPDFKNISNLISYRLFYDYLIALQAKRSSTKNGGITNSTGVKHNDSESLTQNKPGRPKSSNTKPQSLIKSFENKDKLLQELSPLFSNCEKKKAVHIVIALGKLNWLNVENKNSVFHSFSDHFGKVFGVRSNFNKHFSSPDPDMLETTIEDLKQLKLDKLIN